MGQLVRFSGVLFMLLLMLGACCRLPVQQSEKTVRDSVVYQIKDTTYSYSIPAEPIILTEWIECDTLTHKPKPTRSTSREESGSLSMDLDASGRLTVIGQCDSLLTVVKQLEKEAQHYRDSRETIPNTVFKTRKIDIYCRWFTGIFLAAGLLYIIYKLKF